MIIDDRVFYTFGYGVENDLFVEPVVASIANNLIPSLQHINPNGKIVTDNIRETFSSNRICFIADKLGRSRDCCPLNRDAPTSDLDHADRRLPVRLRKEAVFSKLISGPKVQLHPYHLPVSASPHSVPAHHYFEIVFHTIARHLYLSTRESLKKSSLVGMVSNYVDSSFFAEIAGDIKTYFDGIGGRNLDLFAV
jgi:hypothetical protein